MVLSFETYHQLLKQSMPWVCSRHLPDKCLPCLVPILDSKVLFPMEPTVFG